MGAVLSVRFMYVPTGHVIPPAIDRDRYAIYFDEGAKQLWVGDHLIADHIDPPDIEAYLEPYKIKSVSIIGDGTVIADAAFDAASGLLSLTRGTPPSMTRGDDEPASHTALNPGDSFEVVTDTPIRNNRLYNERRRFILPAQIQDVKITTVEDSTDLVLTLISTDGTKTKHSLTMFGSAAFSEISDFATAAQGRKADKAMPALNGTATNATIILEADPEEDLEAATKRYVDNAVKGISGAMHLLGVSTTVVTDGGRECPTIDGKEIDTGDLHAGDVVLYSPDHNSNYVEFAWGIDSTGTGHWIQLGDETSYVLKSTLVNAGDGLTGGGSLASDVTISHEITGTGQSESYEGATSTEVINRIDVDKFGHVTDVGTEDITDIVETVAEELVEQAVEQAIVEADIPGLVAQAVAEDPTIVHTDTVVQIVNQAVTDADIPGQVAQAIADDPTIAHVDDVAELVNQAIIAADIPGLVTRAIAEDPTIAHITDIPTWTIPE